MRMRRFFLAVLAGSILLCAGTAMAQTETRPRIRPTGLRFDIGIMDPQNATTELVLGGTLYMGTIFKPWIHLATGFSHWSANVDSTHIGDSREGELSDTRVFVDMRLNLFTWKILRPYAAAGGALHFVSAKVPDDPVLEDALGSTNAGLEVGFGVTVGRRWQATAEARRQFVSDVGNWSFTAGLGVLWGDVPAPRKETPDEGKPGTIPPDGLDPDTEVLGRNQDAREQIALLEREIQDLNSRATPETRDANRRALTGLRRAIEDLGLFYAQKISIRESEIGVRVTIPASAIFVLGDEIALQPGVDTELARLARPVDERPGTRMVIECHTDNTEDRERALIESQKQAELMARTFQSGGVLEGQIPAVGYGPERPTASNTSPEGRAQNRRVEIHVIPDPRR